MRKTVYFLLFTFCFCSAEAQYAPQAGLPGSTAISASSSLFTGWATFCTIQRGLMDIADPSLGYASAGDSSLATGAPDGSIVSLGDSGIATLTFSHPIYDGPGADFAVFENGFRNVADSSQAFLELAFVEVSSDGINYFRFPSTSLTSLNVQIGNGDYIDASLLDNFAGKYVATYGTPFDLSLLAGTPGLDINNVTHVRLIDVVGSISGHSSHDNTGRIINDPYPTPFPSCGFDLDAVGAIHQVTTSVSMMQDNISLVVFPNPATDDLTISIKGSVPVGLTGAITSITGSTLQQFNLSQSLNTISIGQYPAGMYYLVLHDINGSKWVEKVIKR